MKRLSFFFILFICFGLTNIYAQWVSDSNGNIYRGGNAAIGYSTAPSFDSKLLLTNLNTATTLTVQHSSAADYQYNIRSIVNRDWTKAFAVMKSTTENITLWGNGCASFMGNVSIGTTDFFQAKFTVNGNIRAKEVLVTLDGWSDFVFNENYELTPLNELEAQIKSEGHLPNIPSEAEVKESGVNLGEMQAKLLQKIEELTLYVIDQNKRIEKLEKENTELNNLLNAQNK
jgi:hypothetical protein